MDLREYYENIREITATIDTEFTVVVSKKTPDGGRPGIMTEVTRDLAARLVVDKKAALASPAEAKDFYSALRMRHAQQVAEEEHKRMALDVFSRGGLQALKKSLAPED